MTGDATMTPDHAPHIPVLLRPILAQCAPITGVWLDGTFGAGGYTRALLDHGADTVYAVDRETGGANKSLHQIFKGPPERTERFKG